MWTDVFKDYDLTQAPFVYEDNDSKVKIAYRFTDFFPIDTSQKLIDFVEGMKLPVVGEQEDDSEIIPQEQEVEVIADSSSNGYTINGETCSRRACQGLIVKAALDNANASGKSLSIQDLTKIAKETFRTPKGKEMDKPFFVTKAEWENLKRNSSDLKFAEKFTTNSFTDTDGEEFYVYCNFGANDEHNIANFASALGISTTGLKKNAD